MGASQSNYIHQSYPRLLLPDKIRALGDTDLLAWYRKLKAVRDLGYGGQYDNPKRAHWCYHEARRELTRRGVRDWSRQYPELRVRP